VKKVYRSNCQKLPGFACTCQWFRRRRVDRLDLDNRFKFFKVFLKRCRARFLGVDRGAPGYAAPGREHLVSVVNATRVRSLESSSLNT